MNRQKILLGLGALGQPTELLVNLSIEEHNREDVMEVLHDCIDRIYDGEYDTEGEDE